MSHVLILGLGPVQDFIAAARRTRDLWFGSWMLSELARAAGQSLAAEPGGELIFPDPDLLENGGKNVSYANKLVALVDDPTGAAGRARAAIDERLKALRDEAFRRCRFDPAFVFEAAEKQIDDLVEFYWASAEVGPGEEGYRRARERADRLLMARRRSRLWGKVTWGKDVPKSAIDGQRESVLMEHLFDGPPDGPTPADLYGRFKADENERLCGVSLFKRLGRRPSDKFAHHFLSTGHLAAGPLLRRLRALATIPEKKAKLTEAWNALIQKIGEKRIDLTDNRIFTENHSQPILGVIDASILFEGRLPDLFPDLPTRAERSRAAQPLVGYLRQFLAAAEVPTPCPYFAVLIADGDRMGDAIEQLTTPEAHRSLSSALGRFEATARKIVEDGCGGELVYSGGDDVLAFVPLDRSIECARKLSDEFRGLAKDGPRPTLSVGIGIGHFMEPLQRVLRSAREAEKKAKETRDAFAIRIEKRSGVPLILSGIWGDLDEQLNDFVELLVADRLPDRAAFDLRALARLVEGEPALAALGLAEAERILRRKQPNLGREAGIAPEDLEKLIGRVGPRFNALADRLARQSLTDFSDRLVAARLFAEARVQAELPKKP